LSCIETCHRGHQVRIPGHSASFFCRCGTSNYCSAQKPTKAANPVSACTYVYNGRKPKIQDGFQCKTCFSTPDKYLCIPCSKSICHRGHILVFSESHYFSCTCGDRMKGCALRDPSLSISSDLILSQEKPNEEDSDSAENDICIVCFENKKDTVFYKCGHLACCNHCAVIMKEKNAECPVCRAPILDVTKVYQV